MRLKFESQAILCVSVEECCASCGVEGPSGHGGLSSRRLRMRHDHYLRLFRRVRNLRRCILCLEERVLSTPFLLLLPARLSTKRHGRLGKEGSQYLIPHLCIRYLESSASGTGSGTRGGRRKTIRRAGDSRRMERFFADFTISNCLGGNVIRRLTVGLGHWLMHGRLRFGNVN